MAQRGVLRTVEGGGLIFWCPGCKARHLVDSRWQFDGNYERPTFAPSVLIRSGHYVTGAQLRSDGKCGWCEEAAKDGDPSNCGICHSFVREGKIQFLSDCTHELAGQTVALESF